MSGRSKYISDYMKAWHATDKGRKKAKEYVAKQRATCGTAPQLPKECKECGITKEPASFYSSSVTKDGLRSKCRDCMAAYRAAYAARPDTSSKRREIRARYEASERGAAVMAEKRKRDYAKTIATPELKVKAMARQAVGDAVRAGKLQRLPCAHGPDGCDGAIHGHHWSYDRVHWLDVVWLCTLHHAREHRRLLRLAA